MNNLIETKTNFESTDLDDYFQISFVNKESKNYSFFVLPHGTPEPNGIDASLVSKREYTKVNI